MTDFKINHDLDVLRDFFGTIYENQKAYTDLINTNRLILKKEPTHDCISTNYSILLKETQEKIGEVVLIYDGEIWYKVYKPFRNNGYATEAVSKLIEISKETNFYLSIDFTNRASKKVAKKLGFVCQKRFRRNLIFRKTKK